MIIDNTLPIVAIVGKPNVGKSTLLNNLCGKKVAITDDKPGVTRDRKYYPADLFGWEFIGIDTAGWDTIASHASESIHQKMLRQTMHAVQEADMVIMLVDGKYGLSSLDRDFVEVLRRTSKEVVLVVNKTESAVAVTAGELFALGLGDPVYISATHSIGLDSLHDRLSAIRPSAISEHKKGKDKSEQKAIANATTTITICGRPNVGKSTIFNALLNEERSIVDAEAGTTRDAIAAIMSQYHLQAEDDEDVDGGEGGAAAGAEAAEDTVTLPEGGIIAADVSEIELVDTAGMRKRGKVARKKNFEFSSVGQSIASVRRSDIVILVMEAMNPLERQDLSIARMVINEGKGLVLVFNKIDLLSRTQLNNLKKHVTEILSSAINDVVQPPIIYTSALNRTNVEEIVAFAQLLKLTWERSFNTSLLNRWLEKATKEHVPARGRSNRSVKIKHINQVASKPPTFQLFSNADIIDESYISYLRQRMAERFGLFGVPIRFVCKKSVNPYEGRSSGNGSGSGTGKKRSSGGTGGVKAKSAAAGRQRTAAVAGRKKKA